MIRDLPIALVRQLVEIDHETGIMTWRSRDPSMFDVADGYAERLCAMWNKKFAGRIAFTNVTHKGYLVGKLLGRNAFAHRVAFALYNDRWPEGLVDHDNGDRQDNRPGNLFDVDAGQNARNAKRRSDNRSGCTGVGFHRREGVWYARITVNNQLRILGRFSEFEDAVRVRREAEKWLGFHPRHGRAV